MAVFNCSSSCIEDYDLSGKTWECEQKFGPIINVYPAMSGIHVWRDIRAKFVNYLFGEIEAKGPGEVQCTYPINGHRKKYLKMWNVEFSFIPYVVFKAFEDEGATFRGWYSKEEILCKEPTLVLTEKTYPKIVTFTALFEAD